MSQPPLAWRALLQGALAGQVGVRSSSRRPVCRLRRVARVVGIAGAASVLALYGGPYLVINAWLVAYTWLQHTDATSPTSRPKSSATCVALSSQSIGPTPS